MKEWLPSIAVAVVSYLLGGFPTGVIVSRRRYGLDVREAGSGNMGATNITRVFGWYAGVFVFVVDFLKGSLPVGLLQYYCPDKPGLEAIAGISAVLGHCFSPYLKFKGGKGVASSFGALVMLCPVAAVIAGVTYLVMLMMTKISAIGSLLGLLVVIAYVFLMNEQMYLKVTVVGMAVVVLVRHWSNIRRLVGGIQTKGDK